MLRGIYPFEDSPQEGRDKRMRPVQCGTLLSHKQRPDEKRMITVLDDTDFPFCVCPRYSERPLLQERNILRVHSKVAIVVLKEGLYSPSTAIDCEMAFHQQGYALHTQSNYL